MFLPWVAKCATVRYHDVCLIYVLSLAVCMSLHYVSNATHDFA